MPNKYYHFNPRSHVGNDLYSYQTFRFLRYFNPRSHVGNDATLKTISSHVTLFQSTFPRGERRQFHVLFQTLKLYFNPRSHVGNDLYYAVEAFQQVQYFNPRSHVGNDDSADNAISILNSISIHVPTWGTTGLTYSNGKHLNYFNPRSHVGNDSKFSQIFFAFLCNKYNFSTFYYPFSLFFGVIRFTFLIFVVRILPVFYVYF